MKKLVLILSLALLVAGNAIATSVNVTSAQTVALNFYKSNAPGTANNKSLRAVLNYTRTGNDGTVYFYVFDISPAKGFVIVSGDDAAEPVIGYSFESNFNANGNNVGISDWMQTVSQRISSIIAQQVTATSHITDLWNSYSQGANPISNQASTVGPLCATTWNQEPYYNMYCPYNATDKEYCVTGCVATAMAQIMKYWNFPATGTGSYSYSDGQYGTLSANFGTTTYSWAGMPNSISANNTYIGTLMYQCGVSVAMQYGDDKQGGSGAWVFQSSAGTGKPCAQMAYATYFSYNGSTMQGLNASSYTSSAWITLIQNELNAGRPVEYEGWATQGGHTWVCDGYEANNLFHMNWGWGGEDNGYYSLSDLNPSPYVFSSNDGALIGIQPLQPSACGVPTGLTSGSITNTSAALSWGTVTGAISYTLQWKASSASAWTTDTGLTTNSYPLTTLSSCTAYQFEVLAVCSAGTGSYSATGSFTTTGCAISYCTSDATSNTYEYIKNVTLGTINNTGSKAGYENYTSLSTNLTAGSANTISLTPGFTGSAYKEYWNVWIDYNQNGVFTDAGEEVAKGNSTGTLSLSFTVPTTAVNGPTRMRVQMQYGAYPSSSCATYTYGEVEDYTVNISGGVASPHLDGNTSLVNAVESAVETKLYPNPAQDNLTVEFSSAQTGNAIVNIFDITGRKVITQEFAGAKGLNTFNINTSSLNRGIYIFEINNNGEVQRQKFMIVR